jgi:TolB-like protein/class 3 adenylate cyclase/Tfp pilus assembly protein PilF
LAAERVERKLAAILAADIAGYSRLMGADEEGTLARLKAHRRELIDPQIAEHRGRIVKTTGDGLLVEFASPVEAVRCAGEIQKAMREREGSLAEDQRIEIRIGINLGDVIIDEDDVYGDGVNIAARLEALADPGSVVISSAVFEQVRDRVPDSFEDLGDQQVKNIARPVRVYRLARLPTPPSPVAMSSLSLPDKPSIAVLPFANMSGDPEQEYFADGIVEEIITALSRIRRLFVIARNSSFSFKGQSPDVKQVGRELGVRYVVEGSVRKSGGRVRITAQLIDASTGAHLWADRFDGSLEDVFDLQDRVAISVAGTIGLALEAAEIRRASERSTTDLTAYDFYLRARAHHMVPDRDRILQALDWLAQALARDARYAPALAQAANFRLHLDFQGWAEDAEANRRTAIDLARQALSAAPDDPEILARAAFILAYFGDDISACLSLVDRSLELNPSFAEAWGMKGWMLLWAGQPDPAIAHFERMARSYPRGRVASVLTGIGIAHMIERRFEEAVAAFLASLQLAPSFSWAYRSLASCYAHMGRLDEAREVVVRLRLITAQVVPSHLPWRNPEHRELLLSGLRLAVGEAT